MYTNRKFYNKKEYFIDHEKRVLILDPAFHEKLLNKKFGFNTGFKKIGGTLIGEVLSDLIVLVRHFELLSKFQN